MKFLNLNRFSARLFTHMDLETSEQAILIEFVYSAAMRMQNVCALFLLLPGVMSGCQVYEDPAAIQIYSNSFNDADALDSLLPISRGNNFSIVRDPVHPANHALKIGVVAGDHYGGSAHVKLEEFLANEPTRVYVRYRLWLDTSWATREQRKVARI